MRSIPEILIGRERSQTVAFLGLAIVIAIVFGGVTFTPVGLLSFSSTQYFHSLLLVTGGAAAFSAYLNDGLFVSWVLAAAGLFPFAAGIAVTDAPLSNSPTLLSAINTLAISVGLYAIVVGSIGYVVGIVIRHLLKRSSIQASLNGN